MTKEEFENIVKDSTDLKNQPNTKLVEMMDKLSTDFDLTKNNIIYLTHYLDNVEDTHNKILKEYKQRTNT